MYLKNLLVIFAFATVWPANAMADSLTRLTDRDDLFGWEAVGRVDIEGGGFCTGALIAPHLVLTAAHCVYDRAGKLRNPSSIMFSAGLRDGAFIAERRVNRLVAAKGYDPKVGMSVENVRSDAALLELQTAIPSAVASPFAVYQRPIQGDDISVVSYGRGRDAALSWQRDCNILWRAEGLISFDCNVTFGSSGAPVFTAGDYRAQIVTLVVGGRKTQDGKTVAFGMDLPPVVDALKRQLRAAPKQGFGNGSQGAKFGKPPKTIPSSGS